MMMQLKKRLPFRYLEPAFFGGLLDDVNELAIRLAPRFLLLMHLSKSYLYRTVDLYSELRPPSGTTILPLPKHLVPPPLMVRDVEGWMRSP